MARFVIWKNFVCEFDDIGGLIGFGSIERTNAVTVDRLFCHEFGGFATKIFE